MEFDTSDGYCPVHALLAKLSSAPAVIKKDSQHNHKNENSGKTADDDFMNVPENVTNEISR